MKQIDIILIGAGERGARYADAVKQDPRSRIVAVADPRYAYRQNIAKQHAISPENVLPDWEPLASRKKFAEAVIIATPDSLHVAPALDFAAKGYHILLEKPIAPTKSDCERIVYNVKKEGIIFCVCHVLRYTDYTQKMKQIIDSGQIGEIVNIQHLEPVGYDHQAHSFVRGNWRNEAESTFMLLAKSCHDLDWISYLMQSRCKMISSFGSLKFFKKENKPVAAADRCYHCKCEEDCPYSAMKIYLRKAKNGDFGWPVSVLTPDLTQEGIQKALETGPYGRCVFDCDNDVVDNQVVNMLFENDSTASFTMTAFNKGGQRLTRIFGTKGELYGDDSKIWHFDFLNGTEEIVETAYNDGSILSGHGGGDSGLMKAFISAVAENNPALISSGPDTTLETHRMVFAAEMSRRTGKTISLDNIGTKRINKIRSIEEPFNGKVILQCLTENK